MYNKYIYTSGLEIFRGHDDHGWIHPRKNLRNLISLNDIFTLRGQYIMDSSKTMAFQIIFGVSIYIYMIHDTIILNQWFSWDGIKGVYVV